MSEKYKIKIEYKNEKIVTEIPPIKRGSFKERMGYSEYLFEIAKKGKEFLENQKVNKLEIVVKIKH